MSSKSLKVKVFDKTDSLITVLQYVLIFVLVAILIYACLYAYRLSRVSSLQKQQEGFESKDEVILIHANFCGHCKQFLPKFRHVASKMGAKITFKDFEVNDPMAKQYKANAFPTTFYVRNGSIIDEIAGNIDEERFINWVTQKR